MRRRRKKRRRRRKRQVGIGGERGIERETLLESGLDRKEMGDWKKSVEMGVKSWMGLKEKKCMGFV